MATTYINRHGQGQHETVDEFQNTNEARKMLREYRLSDPSAEYYISGRACRDWDDPPEEVSHED